jgi:phosphate transport system protein
MTNIKSRQVANLDKKFQLLYEKVMQQFSITEEVIQNSLQEEQMEKIAQNENDIDLLEKEIRIEVVRSILLSPRAAELRKLISHQDITNFLETIGDLLVNITQPSKKIDLNLPDFDYFRVTLGKMFSFSKKMVSDAIYSFYYKDSSLAYKIISDDDYMDDLFREISENILLLFQDLSLNEQELSNILNISCVAYIIEQIGDIATHIAEASIYLIEGTDIRHKLSETNDTINNGPY